RARTEYAAALGILGPPARGAISALVHVQKNHPDKGVQEAATTALEKIGMPTANDVPFLIKGLKDPRTDYRASVAQVLSLVCAPENKSAAPFLRDAVKADPDMRIRLFAAQALWSVNRQPDEVLHTFRQALRYRPDG